MNTPRPRNHRDGGFTLIEVLVATAILALIVVLLAAIIGQVNKAWKTGEQRVESFQNGRAVLELIARELSQAAISNKLQFVQNPPDLSGASTLTSMLATNNVQVANSDSIFWQMPYTGNSYGNICQVGYLLTSNTSAKPSIYQLQRDYVPPDNLATTATGHMFRVYDLPATYNPAYATSPWPLGVGAPWLTSAQSVKAGSLTLAQVKTNFQSSLSVLSNCVIGFWVRCLDKNGDPIPWLSTNVQYSGTCASTGSSIKFNSAACFSDATPGMPNSFQYSSPTSTIQANLLPYSVEITLVTVDSKTINSGLTIPSLPVLTQPSDVPGAVSTFMSNLVANHITSARVFSTTVQPASSGYTLITR